MDIKTESRWEFPPDVFWMDPDGQVMDIIGHLTSIRQNPSLFGFTFPPQTKEEIDDAFASLLSANWVRGRMNGAKAYFQIWTAKPESLGLVESFIQKYRLHIENAIIEALNPPGSWELPAKGILKIIRDQIR